MAVHHEMDDGDLPPVPLLPLSRPAAQALNDNPDAPLSPESTGGDGSQASDTTKKCCRSLYCGYCLAVLPNRVLLIRDGHFIVVPW